MWDIETSGLTIGVGSDGADTRTGGVFGLTGAELRRPTGYDPESFFSDWNVDVDGAPGSDDPWDFGAAHNYPALKVDFNGDGAATWEEFGLQREPGPVQDLSATRSTTEMTTELRVAWNAPADTGSGPVTGYEYRISADAGANWDAWAATTATSHTFEDLTAGAFYLFQVRAVSDAAHKGAVEQKGDGTDLGIRVNLWRTIVPAGQKFQIRAWVTNQGSVNTLATTLRYYYSANATLDASDTQLGDVEVPALDADGGSAAFEARFTAPQTLGNYYYGACVVAVAGEPVTDNNCVFRLLTVRNFEPQLSTNRRSPSPWRRTPARTTRWERLRPPTRMLPTL